MFFLEFSSEGIFVSNDEVNLLGSTALIRSEHDGIRCLVGEFL